MDPEALSANRAASAMCPTVVRDASCWPAPSVHRRSVSSAHATKLPSSSSSPTVSCATERLSRPTDSTRPSTVRSAGPSSKRVRAIDHRSSSALIEELFDRTTRGRAALDVELGPVYVDHGMTGTKRERTACWSGCARRSCLRGSCRHRRRRCSKSAAARAFTQKSWRSAAFGAFD
jgi:hypothetical protein